MVSGGFKDFGLYQKGDAFGHFTMQEKLGSGGSAEVYKAFDRQGKKDVVIKVVPEDLDRKTLKRFLAETKILSKLDHPNVVKVFEVGQIDGRHYYVMEYLRAKPLSEILAERSHREGAAFSIEELLSLFADLGSALSYTHAHNVFHRDVKPANILIDGDFKAILMDFGVAKSHVNSLHTETGSLLGTPVYMSPEQLQGKKVDGKSDIYSLGLVIYQCLTGALPFGEENPYAATSRRLTETTPAPSSMNPQIPDLLEKIVLKCLEREGKKRFSDASRLLEALLSVEGFPESRREFVEVSIADNRRELNTLEMNGAAKDEAPSPEQSKTLLLIVSLSLALLFVALFALSRHVPRKSPEYRYGSLKLKAKGSSVELSLKTTPALRCELIYGKHGQGASEEQVELVSERPKQKHETVLEGIEAKTRYVYRLRFIDEEGRMIESKKRIFTIESHRD